MPARADAPAKHNPWWDLLAVALLGGGVLLLLALASFHADDRSWFFVESGAPVRNLCGIFGATLAYSLLSLLGVGALALPLGMLAWGYHLMLRRRPAALWLRLIGAVVGLAGLLALFSLGGEAADILPSRASGGLAGRGLAALLRGLAGGAGAVILSLSLTLVGFLFLTQIGLEQVYARFVAALVHLRDVLRNYFTAWIEGRRKRREQSDLVRKHQERLEAEKAARIRTAPVGALPEIGDTAPSPALKKIKPRAKPLAKAPHTPTGEQIPLGIESGGEFQKPPTALLDPPKASMSIDIDLLKAQAAEIEKKFGEFSVVGKVVQWSPGPVVTTFEFQPDAGVALKSIINRSEDLCMALKATAVRIDRIPGKSTVGIEVPNQQRESIAFREIVESEAFALHPSPLALALGKRMDGAPFISDLAQMPHLLIAGTTGAGKSVGLNSIITSLLMRCTPEECKLVLVDPKRVELGLYADVPHLLTPVVTEAKQAINALKWAVREMEERYKLLAASGVRNIMQFNKLVKDATEGTTTKNADSDYAAPSRLEKPLPYIVVVIDEFADLMLVAPGDVETAVQRLAQMARAVGIHLVLATQRPSVDVISGLIKSNMQARVAFRVAQKIDSRVILDTSGAEKLLGMGDMLFLQPGTSQLLRVHGAYLSETEVAKVAKYLKRQAAPEYNEMVLQDEAVQLAGGLGGLVPADDMELFQRALELAIQEGVLSATLFQNRLRLGQARARRIVDYLDQMGLLGPSEAGKPRKVNVEKCREVLAQSRSAGPLAGVAQAGDKPVEMDEPTSIDNPPDGA